MCKEDLKKMSVFVHNINERGIGGRACRGGRGGEMRHGGVCDVM